MSVQNALLALLAHRPRHGYELHSAFEAIVGGENWDVKPAQIYVTLARLEKKGLVVEEAVEQDGKPEKRIYAITEAGRKELNSWLSTPVKVDHQRQQFFLKLMLCLATGEADPLKIIYSQRANLYRDIHDITTRRGKIDPKTDLAQILLLDQVVMHLEADIRWLEMIETRLDDLRRQPPPVPEPRPRGRPAKQSNRPIWRQIL